MCKVNGCDATGKDLAISTGQYRTVKGRKWLIIAFCYNLLVVQLSFISQA